jgi:hypothetical protein
MIIYLTTTAILLFISTIRLIYQAKKIEFSEEFIREDFSWSVVYSILWPCVVFILIACAWVWFLESIPIALIRIFRR